MSCKRIRKQVQLYVDGALAGRERAEVEAHVAACAACALELKQLRQLTGLLAAAPEQPVSAAFEQNLFASLRETGPAPAAWWERLRLRFEWRLRLPALVTAGSLATVMLAAVTTRTFTVYQEAQAERSRFISAAVARHEQLEPSAATDNWDAVNASIELSTGDLVTE